MGKGKKNIQADVEPKTKADVEEQSPQEEILVHPALGEHDMSQTVVTTVGFTRGSKERWEITFPIPQTDDEAQERYNCDLKHLVRLGVKTISTRPNFKDVGFNPDGTLAENGQQNMQEAADAYRVDARKTRSTAQNAKIKAIARYCEEHNLDIDDVLAKIAQAGNL